MICDKIFECTEHSTDRICIVSCARSMSLTSWARRWCIAGADSLQQVNNKCMIRSAVGGHPPLQTTLWSLCGNTIENRCFTIMELRSHFSQFRAPCCKAPIFQKIVHQMGAKATDTRTQSKAHGVSIDISAVVPWWWWQVSGPDHHRWWN